MHDQFLLMPNLIARAGSNYSLYVDYNLLMWAFALAFISGSENMNKCINVKVKH